MSADEEKAGKPGEKPHGKPASETAPRRVRFPYVRMVMAAVGLVLSAWLWVGESWRFDVTPKELLEGSPGWGWKGRWVGRYVSIRGAMKLLDGDDVVVAVADLGDPNVVVHVILRSPGPSASKTVDIPSSLSYSDATVDDLAGRVEYQHIAPRRSIVVDGRRGRWTTKSVIAVVVFLWGAGIIVSSVWVWKRKREAAAPVACDDAPAKWD